MTNPLQLMRVPTVAASLHLNPTVRAASPAPQNLPNQSVTAIAIRKPQASPVFKRPRLVERPDNVKYYEE